VFEPVVVVVAAAAAAAATPLDVGGVVASAAALIVAAPPRGVVGSESPDSRSALSVSVDCASSSALSLPTTAYTR
jgi:hypothetical protein